MTKEHKKELIKHFRQIVALAYQYGCGFTENETKMNWEIKDLIEQQEEKEI